MCFVMKGNVFTGFKKNNQTNKQTKKITLNSRYRQDAKEKRKDNSLSQHK